MTNLFGKKEYLRLPKDTLNSIRKNEIDNFDFWMNKAVHFIPKKPTQNTNLRFKKSQIGLSKFAYRDFRQNGLIDLSEFNFSKPNLVELISSIQERQRLQFSDQKFKGSRKSLALGKNRLITGLGEVSALEVGMTLHHTYGIPYLPASGIKGLTRSWIIYCCFNNSESEALGSPLFVAMFGGDKNSYDKRARRGELLFWDAFPASSPKIEVDIMNPHYQKYYGDSSGENLPHDMYQPNPVNFLTLGPKDCYNNPLHFCFHIATYSEKKLTQFQSEDYKKIAMEAEKWRGSLSSESTLTEVAMFWLKDALANEGFGAKTSVGYGYFKNESNTP